MFVVNCYSVNLFLFTCYLKIHVFVILRYKKILQYASKGSAFRLGRSYLKARWARAQGLALRGASRLDDLPLNKK